MRGLTELKSNEKPIIAILTYVDHTRDFRGDTQNYLDIVRAGKEQNALVYILPVQSFTRDSPTLRGFDYDPESKRWVKLDLPFPHVVYNRIPYRKFEQFPMVQRVIADCINNPRIKLFNPTFFNKWSLFQWLRQSDVTKGLVPATRKLRDMPTLIGMLNAHNTLYLKPEKGKAGKGIMRIDKEAAWGKTVYILHVQEKERAVQSRLDNVIELWREIMQVIGGQDYIVQQGVPLAVSQTRPFDLRTLVQKNENGEWRVTGIGARVAGASSITTHVPRGGSIDKPSKLLTGAFGLREGRRILERTRKTALRIARQIERASGQRLGEMSMDLGVDRQGNLWFFEANSKPMKFDEPTIRRKSLSRLIGYCTYLANTTGR